MSEDPNINTNSIIAAPTTIPTCPPDVVTDGFVDVGYLIELEIPFHTPRFRKFPLVVEEKPTFDNPLIPGSNRTPLFGFMVDPFFNHDASGNWSPFIYPADDWASNNTKLTIRPQGMEHPLVRLNNTFMGFKGGIEYMLVVNSTALVQGQLSIIRAKYMSTGKFQWNNLQLETEERDNCQLINLSAEKRLATFSSYTEGTEWVNTFQYWLSRRPTILNTKPINYLRNFIFVRPDTDITTLSQNGGTITFRILMRPAADFEFVYPLVPRIPDAFRNISVVDIKFPFSIRDQLVVSQRPFGGPTPRQLKLDDTAYESTVEVSPSTSNYTTRAFPNAGVGYIDIRSYVDGEFPRWQAVTGYRYRWATTLSNFAVEIRVGGTYVLLKEYTIGELTLGTVVFEFFRNTGANIQPPFYFP